MIVKINTEEIKLGQLLKFSGVVGSGSDANYLIKEGLVLLNGEKCTERGKKIRNNDKVCVFLDEKAEIEVVYEN